MLNLADKCLSQHIPVQEARRDARRAPTPLSESQGAGGRRLGSATLLALLGPLGYLGQVHTRQSIQLSRAACAASRSASWQEWQGPGRPSKGITSILLPPSRKAPREKGHILSCMLLSVTHNPGTWKDPVGVPGLSLSGCRTRPSPLAWFFI